MQRNPKKGEYTQEDRIRHEKCDRLCHISRCRVPRDFQNLLNETDFIGRVTNIYWNDARSQFRVRSRYRQKRSFSELEEDFQRQKDFIAKYLPYWLFNLTDILAIEASFASLGEPISKAKISDLINFIFVDRGPGGPPLKDGRNEIWNTHNLKWALREVLAEIKVDGAVTLAVLAKKINALPKPGALKKNRKRLTGKHLQKLLKEHNIDWPKIKREYKQQLLDNSNVSTPKNRTIEK